MNTVCNGDLRERIKSLNPDLLSREIKKWDGISFSKLQPFLLEHYWHGNASINIFRIVGTEHPDYAGLSWIEFLEKGKRMNINLDLYKDNPVYYYETRKKEPSMYFRSIDGGDLYIGEDGNHRTCIAKAAFYLEGSSVLHGAILNDYRVNWEMKRIYDELVETLRKGGIPWRIEVNSERISREDSGEWMREFFRTFLVVSDLKNGVVLNLDLEGSRSLLENILRREKTWRFWKSPFRIKTLSAFSS